MRNLVNILQLISLGFVISHPCVTHLVILGVSILTPLGYRYFLNRKNKSKIKNYEA